MSISSKLVVNGNLCQIQGDKKREVFVQNPAKRIASRFKFILQIAVFSDQEAFPLFARSQSVDFRLHSRLNAHV